MIHELNLQPVYSGVVYSPGWAGWQFEPDDLLASGLMGTKDGETYVRSTLLFELPKLPQDAVILQALLRLHIINNEPPETVKHVCITEAPRDPHAGWSIDEEMSMPYLAEQQLSTEIGLDMDFGLTALVERWLSGSPNHGIIVHPSEFDRGLLAFPRVADAGPVPVLRIVYIQPVPGASKGTLAIGPDTGKASWELPWGPIAVKNLGLGMAWVSPLYLLDEGEEPLDPAGIPEGVLEAGEYLIIEPRLRALRMSIRVDTALSETTVMIIPLAAD